MRLVRFTTSILTIAATTGVASAAVFPDVPTGHLFQEPIEQLVNAKVINGNPDGTFAPDRTVNRAEMLKMLYIAEGLTPDPLSVRCFPDVEIGSWYEPYVCDAANRRYVTGYADGTFRPSAPVNRVEALKMITQVFEIPVLDITEEDREIINFVDVSVAAWYTKYLYTAYSTEILPVAGQAGAYFYPSNPLQRGEAAAYIYNALKVELQASRQDDQRSSSSTSSSTSFSSTAVSVSSENVSSQTEASNDELSVSFPFDHDGKFTRKRPFSYTFEVEQNTMVDVEVALQQAQPGTVSCRLYLIKESGFSDQYYLGFEQDKKCHVLAYVIPGKYQLQVQPTVSDTTYSVEVSEGKGDSNDGFADALSLTANAPRTEVLTATDLADWYTFTIGSKQKMTLDISNPAELSCLIYPMSDVDLDSFSGPECDRSYSYPPGTYFVSVGRKAPLGAQQSYTIRLEKD